MKSIGVLLLRTVGAGLSALNIAGRNANIKILEFSPLGKKSQLLVEGDFEDIQNYIIGLRTSDIERSLVLPNYPEKLIRNYLGQDCAHFQSFALIIEGNFLGDLMKYAAEFSNLGLSIVDFRLHRTSESIVFLVMTGQDSEKTKSLTTELKRDSVQITYLSNLSEGFLQYLDTQIN